MEKKITKSLRPFDERRIRKAAEKAGMKEPLTDWELNQISAYEKWLGKTSGQMQEEYNSFWSKPGDIPTAEIPIDPIEAAKYRAAHPELNWSSHSQ